MEVRVLSPAFFGFLKSRGGAGGLPRPRVLFDYNANMSDAIDRIMERASLSLVAMDYLACEDSCLEALAMARDQANWLYYARILLPLQEARRQRRMIAADGAIRLGTSRLSSTPEAWLDANHAGCIVLTRPHTRADAAALAKLARQRRLHVEVLFADCHASDNEWTLRSHAGPEADCRIAAPPQATRDVDTRGGAPAGWFIHATEALGDAALKQIDAPLGDVQRITQVERRLAVVTDHEFLHQWLAEAARAAQTADNRTN